jgi:hypothetical protein
VAVPVGIPVAVRVGVGEFETGVPIVEVGACVAVNAGGAVAIAVEVGTAVVVGVALPPASSSPPQPSKTDRPSSGKTTPYRAMAVSSPRLVYVLRWRKATKGGET